MGYLDDVLDSIGATFDGGKGFTAGTHKVKILLAEEGVKHLNSKNIDADIITVSVQDPEDEERIGEAVLYFHTEGGAKMAVTKVAGLLSHNAPEDKKETIKTLCKEVFTQASEKKDLKLTRSICLKLLAEKLIGKEGYAYAEPTGNYDTTKYVDLWHYEYTAKGDNADKAVEEVAEVMGGGEAIDIELPEGF